MEIPRSVLVPIKANGELEEDENVKTVLIFEIGELVYDTKGGFGFQDEMSLSFPASHPKAQIGKTGINIGFTKAKLDLSKLTNIPEADAAGYPTDFVGLYIQDAVIEFTRFGDEDPNRTSVALSGQDLLIGTGGLTGAIILETGGLLYRKFGNFEVGLDVFSLTFQQNSIAGSSISGTLTIPRFQNNDASAQINIQASIFDNGNFKITAKPFAQPYPITLPNVFTLEVVSLEIGNEARGHYMEISGTLSFIADVPVLGDVLPKNIQINKFRIWDNGDFEFPGGRIKLQKSFKLKVGPVKLEVDEIGLAPYKRMHEDIERKYRSFAFDGMLNTGRAGVQVGGNGIKYYFTVDGLEFDHFIRIDGIDIDISIPNNKTGKEAAFTLKGHLSMKEPDPAIPGSAAEQEYSGSVAFSLPKLKLAGSAGMRLNPTIPAFVVDIGMELANPIPIGGTGLGIYGFRGLIAQHYMPDKNGYETWLDYYNAPSKGVGLEKFESRPGTSLGAGMAMATTFDSGKVFSSKVFLLLGLPDVFLIEGQAAILRRRIGLDEDIDPPFTALIVIGDKSIHGNLAVDYNLPEEGNFKGSIMSLQGALDMAFFFNNASGWYLNIGKDNPESERVRAKVLTLFNAHAYVMLSMQGIKAGAGAKFDFNKKLGPVSIGIGAFLNLAGFISFKPFQLGASIQLGGYAYIKVFKVKLGLAVAASLAVEAPHPFNIIGSLRIIVSLPYPLKDLKLDLDFSWRISKNRQPLLEPIPILQLPQGGTNTAPAVAVNILTGETFRLNYVITDNNVDIPLRDSANWKYNFTDSGVTIPLDSFIDIELLKPVKPGDVPVGGGFNQVPIGYKELFPPQQGVDTQVEHQFELNSIEIKAWASDGGAGGQWVPYNVYEAVTAIVNSNNGPDSINLSELKQGYWQFMEPGRFNKIRLLSQNMFSYSSKTLDGSADLDSRNFKKKDVFCFDAIREEVVIDWKDETADTVYPQAGSLNFKGAEFTFNNITASAKYSTGLNDESLYMEVENGKLLIHFPEPVTFVSLAFGANKNNIAVHYAKTTFVADEFGQAIPFNVIVETTPLINNQQDQVLTYDNSAQPIDNIVLELNKRSFLDYKGDLVIGGHFQLPADYIPSGDGLPDPEFEVPKGLMFVTVYSRSFTASEVLTKHYRNETGIVGQWPLNNNMDVSGNKHGMISGSPETIAGYYEENGNGFMQLSQVYHFTSNQDALFVQYDPALKVENGSFSFELTAIFTPQAGMSTLFHKVNQDAQTGYQKGYSLHLIQENAGQPDNIYTTAASVPSFKILLTFYDGMNSSSIEASELYTVDCDTSKLTVNQYHHILVSINRAASTLEVFINKVSKSSASLPAELPIYEVGAGYTYLNELRYLSADDHIAIEDNQLTEAKVIQEVEILEKGISKVIQPVWRPDTTFAVVIKTQDRVDGVVPSEGMKTHIFGFRTAGPIGHFHQQNTKYQELAAEDRADEFKLANLRSYIDFERSYPDAQGRFDLSKPLFYQDPQLKLFFTQPYVYAMFSNWSSYQNLPAVNSRLEIQLLDPEGITLEQQLVWEPLQEVEINDTNSASLPEDLKIIYQLNKAASESSCNPMVSGMKKSIQKGYYQFDDLQPDKLYTALFNSVYAANLPENKIEVHKYNFKTSRYASFQDQVASFIIDATPGNEEYAIDSRLVSLSQEDINLKLISLINSSTSDDPATAVQYTGKLDRILYGGLSITNLESPASTVITLIVNTDPVDVTSKRLLGILICNPEPFNDPKLPEVLQNDTVQLTLTLPDNSVSDPSNFIYIHSADTSSVLITNEMMNIPAGTMSVAFRYKIFNGVDYTTLHDDYSLPVIDLDTFL